MSQPAVAPDAVPAAGRRVVWTTSRIRGSPEPPSPYLAQRAFPRLQFAEPLELVALPGTDRLVVAEHAGTPWATEAERELRQPMGWVWRELYTGVAERIAQNNNANNRPRVEAPVPPPKPRRDPPAL